MMVQNKYFLDLNTFNIKFNKLKFKSEKQKQVINNKLIDFMISSKIDILKLEDVNLILTYSNNLNIIENFDINKNLKDISNNDFIILLCEIGTNRRFYELEKMANKTCFTNN